MNSLGGVGVGDKGSGEELVTVLYVQFKGALYAHVLGLTNHDRQWTEDVVQETLIRAWQNAETLVRDPRMLRGWLVTVARRIVIDGWRTRQARPQEVELTSPDAVEVPDETEQRLSIMVINDVIGRLGAEHRAVIYETYVCGRTVREAALVLGIPEGTVKSRVYNAMKILRRALREWH
ncbi:RNA polymerase sigma-70 factor (ECF subfamily) [Saccharothrix ecbatanensis]|uniref:RNA polymerase sigma-70 factor (ECF subfamily) n=1 Tax=Saccharothrix ecbatanensis TaxID=1105145 RepID=A0A7W9M5S9_9PSEU|nr:sigma-70 family RNA polymerase sigma factor [Saccharothrix ecbatanensis]MBB5808244.1 RNA polymerase sigma-70 factor (ECF subfamily) [Saccharothrix ecbatanensis]